MAPSCAADGQDTPADRERTLDLSPSKPAERRLTARSSSWCRASRTSGSRSSAPRWPRS